MARCAASPAWSDDGRSVDREARRISAWHVFEAFVLFDDGAIAGGGTPMRLLTYSRVGR